MSSRTSGYVPADFWPDFQGINTLFYDILGFQACVLIQTLYQGLFGGSRQGRGIGKGVSKQGRGSIRIGVPAGAMPRRQGSGRVEVQTGKRSKHGVPCRGGVNPSREEVQRGKESRLWSGPSRVEFQAEERSRGASRGDQAVGGKGFR